MIVLHDTYDTGEVLYTQLCIIMGLEEAKNICKYAVLGGCEGIVQENGYAWLFIVYSF